MAHSVHPIENKQIFRFSSLFGLNNVPVMKDISISASVNGILF